MRASRPWVETRNPEDAFNHSEVFMSTLNGDSSSQKPAPGEKTVIPETARLVAVIVLFLFCFYLFYANIQITKSTRSELDRIDEQLQILEKNNKLAEASLSGQIAGLRDELEGARNAVNSTKTELRMSTERIQANQNKANEEIDQAMKAAAQVEAQVQEAKNEAESKITKVNTEVGGVKSDVVQVKTDLENTKTRLEGAQKKLASVGETLEAAIAKNSTELAELRLKGERNYFEFEFPKKKSIKKIEDIRLILTDTDHKKGRYSMKILVDDSELEKKNLLINEPVQFLVGRSRVRYEVVINWVEKDRAGGYLAVPKDKALSSAGVPVKK
jgi:hypothetical protein